MSKKLNVESLTKKLKNVANTQDSIPMFSLWIIHHKAHHQLIVDTWLEILKTSKPKHRLTLWYLANDVIQSCHKKKADIYKEYFANILPEAIAFLRDKAIQPGVERVLNVWMNRNVYDTELIDQLHAALLTNRPPDRLRQKLLAEYKPSTLVDSISAFKKREDMILFEEKHLKNVRVDASSSDDIHKLKDKVGGERFSRNFEESALNIERFMSEYEKYVGERKKLVEGLTQGAVFYRAQYHEAKIVVNAYQNFDARVSKMKKLLDQVKQKFSPNTPPDPMNDQTADMDMSDSDQELGNKPSKIVAVDTKTNRNLSTRPSAISAISTITPTQQSGSFINRPGMRGASNSSSLFSSIQQDSITNETPEKLNIPISFNGLGSTSFETKVRSPSASPPSPEGSPELNISSPPRHQSLESRLADIFSGNSKVGNVLEATGNDSDADSIPNIARSESPKKQQESADDEKSQSDGGNTLSESEKPSSDTKVTKPIESNTDPPWSSEVPKTSAEDIQTSWQNTIPVIGGNRHPSTTQGRSYMENLHLVVDGSSTPLQDESLSGGENYAANDKKTISPNENPAISSDSMLPPPSFSGDALNFLTKFMGQKTNTVLSQQQNNMPGNEWNATVTTAATQQPVASQSGDILQNLGIDWNSIQQIASTATTWPRRGMETTHGDRDMRQNPGNQPPTLVNDRERDTDYRMPKKDMTQTATVTTSKEVAYFTESLKETHNRFPTSVPASEPMNQFIDSLRKKSSEKAPSFAPVSDDVIVEEEEILVDEENKNEQQQQPIGQNHNAQSVNNFENSSPTSKNFPIMPQRNNFTGQKRPIEEHISPGQFEPRPRMPRFESPHHPPRPRFPHNHNPPFRATFRARVPNSMQRFRSPVQGPPPPWHGDKFSPRGRRPPRPSSVEDEYYDMLYDELRPDFNPRPGRPRNFRPRMPYL